MKAPKKKEKDTNQGIATDQEGNIVAQKESSKKRGEKSRGEEKGGHLEKKLKKKRLCTGETNQRAQWCQEKGPGALSQS